MKKITQKMNKKLCDGRKMLTTAELKALTQILDQIEWREYQPYRHISGGYAEADMFNYDDKYIDFELKSGVCDEDGKSCDTTQHKIPRNILLKKVAMQEKLRMIDAVMPCSTFDEDGD